MRDDGNSNGEANRCSNDSARPEEPTARPDLSAADEVATRDDWVDLDDHPKPADLGYEAFDWESFRALDGSDQVMFLPAEESALRDDEFVVVTEDSLVDLDDQA